MFPTTFDNFFLALSSGGAALIGLLFVATSISPERVFARNASPELTTVAASAFTALVNTFFIATSALLPNSNVGYIAVVMALIGSVNSLSLGFHLVQTRWQLRQDFQGQSLWLRLARDLVLVIGSLGVYLFELFYGLQLVLHPHDVGYVYELATMLLVIDGIGLIRAWEMLGARRGGLFGWLNPLSHLDPPSANS